MQIGNDVWIRQRVSVKSGVVIGDGAVIRTGAIATMRYRFSEKQIESLMEIKWWEKSCSWLEESENYFLDIDEFIKHIKAQS